MPRPQRRDNVYCEICNNIGPLHTHEEDDDDDEVGPSQSSNAGNDNDSHLRNITHEVGKLVLFDHHPSTENSATKIFGVLADMDEERARRMKQVVQVFDEWNKDGMPVVKAGRELETPTFKKAQDILRSHKAWMGDTLARLQAMRDGGDSVNNLLAKNLRQNLHEHLNALGHQLNNWDLISQRHTYCDSSRYSSHPLHDHGDGYAVALYLAVALNLLFHIDREACSVVLGVVNLLLTKFNESVAPTDLRTARKELNLDPVKHTFACCPSCDAVHEPTYENGVTVYPSKCPATLFPASKGQCGAKLTKLLRKGGVAFRVPIRPYVMQDFTDFRARLYSRPGIEEMIRRYHRRCLENVGSPMVSDINEAAAIRGFKDCEGNTFVDSKEEIRTVWSLSYDGYNPFHNKASGKSASVGAIGMACLSLPPSIRTKPENLYLVGLVPGPRQPRLEGLNGHLAPLVKVLKESYEGGTWFEQTYEHPEGRRSREAVIPSINDLPGALKLIGHASHTATLFCAKCHVTKKGINNIDTNSDPFKFVTQEEYRQAALDWRNAKTKAQRKASFKRTGIRYSVLLELDYWNPVSYVVIDGMHTLFLGIVRHHFRVVVGTHWNDGDDHEEDPAPQPEASERDLKKVRNLLLSEALSQTKLGQFSIAVLSQVCEERGLVIPESEKKGRRKKPYVFALMAAVQGAAVPIEAHPTGQHLVEKKDNNNIEYGLKDVEVELGDAEKSKKSPMLDTNDLKKIQDDIKNTLRPRSQGPPPKNFGSPAHGKLKADQWRTCIEFDLPVSLVKLWVVDLDPKVDSDLHARRLKVLQATFDLSIAIRWAISTCTSPNHAENYLKHMKSYLSAIRELDPDSDLHPIHHNSLHISFFLEQFGPMRGWWMYFFERLIGALQKIPINYKFGELEETVLTTFCAASELRASVDRPQCPPILKECAAILQSKHRRSIRDFALDEEEPAFAVNRTSKLTTLEGDIFDSLPFQPTMSRSSLLVQQLQSYTQADRVFSPQHISLAQSVIFVSIQAKSELTPGTIRSIFEYDDEVYFVIHTYSHKIPSFFDSHPQLGASVWSSALNSRPLVMASSSRIYTGNRRPWATGQIVVRPLIEDYSGEQ
ncbi:hypothetical protein MD484_g7906, partial [Candolleomyces efflorescens]